MHSRIRPIRALLLIWVCLTALLALSKQPEPLVKTDLSTFGYHSAKGLVGPFFVDFADPNHVVVGWETFDNYRGGWKVPPLSNSPARLHIAVIDAATGHRAAAVEIPTLSFNTHLAGTHDGHIVACVGAELRLYTTELELVRKQAVDVSGSPKWRQPCSPTSIQLSPDRRFMTLRSGTEDENQLTILDTRTFVPLWDWREARRSNQLRPVALSDHWLVSSSDEQYELRRAEPSLERVRVLLTEPEFYSVRVFFVDDVTLVVTNKNTLTATQVDGKELFRETLGENRSFGVSAAAPARGLFAVMENRERGLTAPELDMYSFAANERVLVYSLAARRIIWSLKVRGRSPWPPFRCHWNAIALSPDGKLLAVVSDGAPCIYPTPVDSQ